MSARMPASQRIAPSLIVSQSRRCELPPAGDFEFGSLFTPHMVTAHWSDTDGWHDFELIERRSFEIDPAAMVFHYGQAIFEGLKAYRYSDGRIALFRPALNAARFHHSAERLCMPSLPDEMFLESLRALVRADGDWIPAGPEGSLYLRPFMVATEATLQLRPAKYYRYCLIASPARSYFAASGEGISVWVSDRYSRASCGGTGTAKCAGNYAASMAAMRDAKERNCDQVLFLDAGERRWVEELGGMNLFIVNRTGELVTPPLTGTILNGVTRSSILDLAREFDLKAIESPIEIHSLLDQIESGDIVGMFAVGTAAVVTPIAELRNHAGIYRIRKRGMDVAETFRSRLVAIQQGAASDPYGWVEIVD
jgi:branched-chain amino acid aminotransferase